MNCDSSPLNAEFYLRNAEIVARDLLGRILVHDEGAGERFSGRIVETEAYLPDDPASHSFRGPTRRNSSMFLEGGHCYVYRIYGINHCFNAVTGAGGVGAAVLIRALEPLEGIREMWMRRFGELMPADPGKVELNGLCSGPGKLCKALGITAGEHDGADLAGEGGDDKLFICTGKPVPDDKVGIGRRIGLSTGRGDEELRRWCITDSFYLSRSVVSR